jgi:hypothetical protein
MSDPSVSAPPPGPAPPPGHGPPPPGPGTPWPHGGGPVPPQQPPQPPPQGKSPVEAYGLTSLLIGAAGLLASFVPLVGLVGLLFAGTGLAFGVVALRHHRRGTPGRRGLALGGVVVSALAVVVACVTTVLAFLALDELQGTVEEELVGLPTTAPSPPPEPSSPAYPFDEPSSAATAGPGPSAPAPGGQEVDGKAFSYGETGTTQDEDGVSRLHVRIDEPRTFDEAPGEFGTEPLHGTYVAVPVALEGAKGLSEPVEVYRSQFTVRAENGREIYSTLVTGLSEGLRSTTEVGPGERLEAVLVFDMAAEPAEVVFTPDVLGTPGVWR